MKPACLWSLRGWLCATASCVVWSSALLAAGSAQADNAVGVDWPAVPGMAVQGQAYHAVLDNGLELWVKPDRRAPTAVHMLWLKVGSVDEVDGTSGVAHVLEHMMFKGTPTLKPGEFSRQVAALGGRENAFTSRDATAYHLQLPSQHLEAAIRLEADRFARNQWSDDEFRREIEVIKEERRQRIDDQPRAQLAEALAASAWQAHPYRRPIIGWMNDLDNLTPEDVRAFYQRWYVPGNAAVVVAGDVDPAQVLAWVRQAYGAVPARPVPVRKPQLEPTQTGTRLVEVKAATEQPYVALAYPAPRLTDPDAADADSQDALALTLLSAVLNGYPGARLGRQLVQHPSGQRVADEAGAGFSGFGRGPGQFVLDGVPAPGQTPTGLAAALKAEVARVAEQGVAQAELDRVKNQWRAAEVYKLDALFSQARELGSQWVNGWGADASTRWLQALGRITPAQVQAVAQRYVRDDRLTQVVLVPDAQVLAERKQASPRPRLSGRHGAGAS